MINQPVLRVPPKVLGKYAVDTTRQNVPFSIDRPPHHILGLVEKIPEEDCRTPKGALEHKLRMTEAGKCASMIRYLAGKMVTVGNTTENINKAVHDLCIESDFYPGALDYQSFPRSVSISVNEVACHGIPDKRPLDEGDVVKIDFISYVNGRYGDCCGTFVAGKPSQESKDLINVGKLCLEECIKICGPDVPFIEVGRKIEKVLKKYKMNVVKQYTGHHIGKNIHSKPLVYHYPTKLYNAGKMKIGTAFTIEPIITTGSGDVYMWDDDWSIVTSDGKWCAQFEDTLLVTEDGVKNLTDVWDYPYADLIDFK